MKKNIAILFILLFSKVAFANEDTYIAIELSNVHIKIMVGDESSIQLEIINSYAETINDFVNKINPSQKVFIQFDEDYCYNNLNYFLLSYGDFKDFVIPYGFPFSYPYDMGFVEKENGLTLTIAQTDFKLKPVLQLIEYGLLNKNYIIANQETFKTDSDNIHPALKTRISPEENKRIKTIDLSVIDSITKCNTSLITRKYLLKKNPINNFSSTLNEKEIEVFLQNDSIHFLKNTSNELIILSTLYCLRYESVSQGLFLFNTNSSFYFLNKELKSNQTKYELSFGIGCLDGMSVSYLKELMGYKIMKTDYFGFGGSEIWDYFNSDKNLIESRKSK
jgi:hypothetical protein